MAPLSRIRITTRLSLGFAAVAVLTVALGLYSYLTVMRVSATTDDLYDHPFTVLTNLLQARTEVLLMEHHLESLPYAHNQTEIDDHISALGELDAKVNIRIDTIGRQFLGNHKDVDDVVLALARWRALRDEGVQHFRAGRKDMANDAIFERAAAARQKVTDEMQDIIGFATAKAEAFHNNADTERDVTLRWLLASVVLLTLAGWGISRIITASIVEQLATLRMCMTDLAGGKLDVAVPFRTGRTELDDMGRALQILKEASQHLESQRWIKAGVATIGALGQAVATPRDLARVAVETLVRLTGAGTATFYLWNEESQLLERAGSWAHGERKHLSATIRPGEGLVGQCLLEKAAIVLTEVPDDYIRVSSSLGDALPRVILAAPACSNSGVVAVVELGSFTPFTEAQRTLIDEALPLLALNIEIMDRTERTRILLERSQMQAQALAASEEELRAQSDALQSSNEDLRAKSQILQEQAEELRASEEELRASDEELRNQREELQTVNDVLVERSRALEVSREEADRRALEVEVASRYKSEFLANMSHELRTPLNSLLILAKSLADNENEHLDGEETECAHIIHESGTQLLRLINDILDLSKVEAGKMELVEGDIDVERQRTYVERRFKRLAEARRLKFSVIVEGGLPQVVRGDLGKMEQVLNNLVGNAIKFTQSGAVTVRLRAAAPPAAVVLGVGTRVPASTALCIEVEDSGIGIPADKIDRIFVAFEQIDGSSSRQFGGTGLGLTIARRLAVLMGGDITVESQHGKGSLFRLWLPLVAADESAGPVVAAAPVDEVVTPLAPVRTDVADDRESIVAGDRIILVVEDDGKFARIVRDLSHKRGFKCLVANDGRTGVELATRWRPIGIVLDIGLPEMDGWQVMEALKQSPVTRHIPVHIMSAAEGNLRGLGLGAVGYLTKPVDKGDINAAFDKILHFADGQPRRLLLVDDDANTRMAVRHLLEGEAAEVVEVGSGEEALERLGTDHFDCMILDLGLPGISGMQVLDHAAISGMQLPPVIVYSARELSADENLKLHQYTDSIVIKGARSPERLQDEVALFLHSVHAGPPAPAVAGDFSGRTVLVVDDDMRNVFALSKVLRARGFNVVMAQDGARALAQLEQSAAAIEIVLMDIMMPGMDGYATIRAIRAQERFASLPIIALTAKAMRGDREKCLEAGANEYVSKPVDVDGLLVTMRAML
jgi:CheY-like chemotaxis protein